VCSGCEKRKGKQARGDGAIDGGVEISDGAENAGLRRRLASLTLRLSLPGKDEDVNDLAKRDVALDGVQEADKFLMPPPHVAAECLAVEHVERGVPEGDAKRLQGGRLLALNAASPAGLERQRTTRKFHRK
jgi:hypothetical protein